jgi:hypothetical protein
MHSISCLALLFSLATALPTASQITLADKPPQGPIALKDARLLLEYEYLPFEAGNGVSPDGFSQVAASTYMRGVTSDMVEWWFSWANSTSDYLFWHPRDHVNLTWVPPKNPGASVSSRYVGGSHLAEEYIGDELMSMNITFQDPGRYFGPNWKADFAAKDYTTAICARVAMYDKNSGTSFNVGHLIHLLHKEPDGVRMRSRFWLGDLDDPIPGIDPNTLIPENLVRGLTKHCPEEMTILATVLPKLWRENSEEGKKGVETGWEKTNMKSKSYQGPAGVKK